MERRLSSGAGLTNALIERLYVYCIVRTLCLFEIGSWKLIVKYKLRYRLNV